MGEPVAATGAVMGAVTIREGGAIPQKQVVALLLALGRDAQVARLDGRLADVLNN